MTKDKIDPLQYLNKDFLTTRIGELRRSHALLLQKAQSIMVSAQKAERQCLDDANATYGAIQQLEEILGVCTEEVAKALGKEVPAGKHDPSQGQQGVVKTAKETAISRQRQRAAARKVAKTVVPSGIPVRPPHPDSTAAS